MRQNPSFEKSVKIKNNNEYNLFAFLLNFNVSKTIKVSYEQI